MAEHISHLDKRRNELVSEATQQQQLELLSFVHHVIANVNVNCSSWLLQCCRKGSQSGSTAQQYGTAEQHAHSMLYTLPSTAAH